MAGGEGISRQPVDHRSGRTGQQPQNFGIEDLLKDFPQEERIYRLRCVEAWSMVIPWEGFTLASLLKMVEPTSDAKYRALLKPCTVRKKCADKKAELYPWPYQEGLRLDEAMNDLTFLATGLYGEPQCAAKRRAHPLWWCRGNMDLNPSSPLSRSSWLPNSRPPYGITSRRRIRFYANVNPDVDHPRWSQATERRIGELNRRPTLIFNGYGEKVAALLTTWI